MVPFKDGPGFGGLEKEPAVTWTGGRGGRHCKGGRLSKGEAQVKLRHRSNAWLPICAFLEDANNKVKSKEPVFLLLDSPPKQGSVNPAKIDTHLGWLESTSTPREKNVFEAAKHDSCSPKSVFPTWNLRNPTGGLGRNASRPLFRQSQEGLVLGEVVGGEKAPQRPGGIRRSEPRPCLGPPVV